MWTDNKILQLWRDPTFAGSYRGIKTFQILLKTDLNIDISEKRLYKIIKKDPIFLIHQKRRRNFLRRSYDLRFYGELVQADIAYMFPFSNFLYFLVLIDCFSSKIFVSPLKSKTSIAVRTAFEKLFQKFNSPIQELQTDQGKEFLGCKNLFKQEKILFKLKYGKNKANFAEWAIMNIKKRLYKMLRGTLSHNWPELLLKVVDDYNNTPLRKLGWLTPNSIKSEYDSIKVETAQKKAGFIPFREPNIETRQENESNYFKNKSNISLNSYVYLDFNESLFGKSFDVQVCKYVLTFSVKLDKSSFFLQVLFLYYK
jgi:hypothetical protein